MIILTRLDGARFAINQDHIERIEETPTTVIRLDNGTSYTVRETLDQTIEIILHYRHRVQGVIDIVHAAPTPPHLGIVAPFEED